MKLKYYLRGLGIGIVVTGIIMSIAGANTNKSMTDVEIIQKAQKLGMVTEDDYNLVKEDLTDAKTSIDELKSQLANTDSSQSEQTSSTTEADAAATQDQTAQNPAAEDADSSAENATDADSANTNNVTTEVTNIDGSVSETTKVTFSIAPGMGSESVAELLEQKGIIDSAAEFNKYIVDTGNANNLQIGEFEVTSGESFDTILNKITAQ